MGWSVIPLPIHIHSPAWRSLNALAYHWATQCLPLPTAWFLSQMPPVFNKV
jgi:hypothetical protein